MTAVRGHVPPSPKVVLIDNGIPREARVDPSNGRFSIDRVPQGVFQVAACAGTNYVPQVRDIEIKAGRAPWVDLTLPYADRRKQITGRSRNGQGVVVLALAYLCEVARTTVDQRGEYAFVNLPRPPEDYQIGTLTRDGTLVTTKRIGPENPLTGWKTEVALNFSFDNAGSVTGLNAELVSASIVDPLNRAQLAGRVLDPQGVPAMGVTVSAVNRQTSEVSKTTTNDEGYYLVTVPAGAYDVKVEGGGFKVYTQENVSLAANQALNVDLSLDISDIASQITIATDSEPDLITSSLGTVIENRQATGLPLDGRNFYELSLLVPGNPVFGDELEKARLPRIVINGVDSNRKDIAANIPRVQDRELPLEAVDEMIVSSHEEAAYGRNPGGTVAAEIKRGTNQVRGSAFYWQRNSALAARDFFDLEKSHSLSHQFGASIGGPALNNRLSYFAAYEGNRDLQARPRLVSVPSAASLMSSRSILAVQGLVENPLSSRLLTFFPVPDRAGIFNNRLVNSPIVNDADNFVIRIDPEIGSDRSFAFVYSLNHAAQLFPLAPSFFNGFRTRFSGLDQSLSGTFVTSLTPRAVNQFRVGYAHSRETFVPEDDDFNPNVIGLNTGVDDPDRFGLPLIKITGFDALGGPIELPNRQEGTDWQINNLFMHLLGTHLFRAGVDLRYTTVNTSNDAGTRGRIVFDGSVLGDPLADFLAGLPAGNTATVRGDTRRKLSLGFFDWFVQDDYRPSTRLRISFGLRYSINSSPSEELNQLSGFLPDGDGLVQVGSAALPKLFKKDTNNLAPRISFAWDPTGARDTALRASWGIYFSNPSPQMFSSLCPCPNSTSAGVTMNPVGVRPTFAISPTRPIPFGPGMPIFDGPSLIDISTVDPDLRNPYIQDIYFGIHHKIRSRIVLEISYSGLIGRQLYRTININQPFPGDPATRDSRRPFFASFPEFGAINMLNSSGQSSYHAATVGLTRNLYKGFSFTGGYTFSKSIDDVSAPSDLPQDSRNLQAERGPSRFDQRHRLSLSVLYEIPSLRSHQIFRRWQLAATFILNSGNPFTPLTSFDNSGTGTFLDRPDLIDRPESNLTRTQLYSATAFRLPPPGNFGNAGRNSLHSPGTNQLNVSLSKRFQVMNERFVEFRTDVFNLLNRTNFSPPNYFIDEPSFGTVVSTQRSYGSRRLQLGIRLTF